jgi:hypothetical protein
LILATATFTPTPITPTPAPLPVIEAGAIATLAPTPPPRTALLPSEITLNPIFLSTMAADLAQNLQIDAALIQLASLETATWITRDLGCSWEAGITLPIAGYAVRWLVGKTVYVYHTEGETRFQRCEGAEIANGELLLAADPIAAEMVALAQRQVAQQTDLPVRRIRWVSVAPYTWTDTSLGCPLADATYTPAELPGYRIVVAAGETEYAFHTDSQGVYPCPLGREVLPK